MNSGKLCECGCGMPAPISKATSTASGWIKGQPKRFVSGHHKRKVQPTLNGILGNSVTTPSGCLEWQGSARSGGYGQIWESGVNKVVHRVVYELTNGPLLPGEVVRHQCDNPRCVNPDHLVVGTHADNMRDMTERQRQARGESHVNSKLTEAQVLEILGAQEPQRVLAREFGVSQHLISLIKQGKAWKHLQGVQP